VIGFKLVISALSGFGKPLALEFERRSALLRHDVLHSTGANSAARRRPRRAARLSTGSRGADGHGQSRTTGRRAGFNGRGRARDGCTLALLTRDVSSWVRPGFVDRATLRTPTRLTLIEEARHSAIPFCPDTP